jgi:transcriptional regulator with XRE-family HTH domain
MQQHGSQDGSAIRRIRKARDITATDLAGRVGIRLQSLYNIELGNRPAGIGLLVKISRELGVQVDQILRDDDSEPEVAAGRVKAA